MGNTINLHLKYPKALAAAFSKPSYLKGKTSSAYDFLGSKTIRISSIITQAMNDYSRTGTARYGTPTELSDNYQELSLSQDKSFTITIDKGNNVQQDLEKDAATVMAMQLREQTVPTADKYAFAAFVKNAGTVKGLAKPDKTNIVGALLDALQILDDNLVPDEGRTIWITSEMHKFVRQSSDYMSLQDLGRTAMSKGEVGELGGATVVKLPSSYLSTNPYLPANGCFFLITFQDATLFPHQINEAKIHQDPPGISGSLLEGRVIYDAFVIGQKAYGVYAGVLSTLQQTTPTITDTGSHNFTIASASANTIVYTTDGTDPRYSPTAVTFAGASTGTLSLGAAGTVNAVAYRTGYFPSTLASQAIL